MIATDKDWRPFEPSREAIAAAAVAPEAKRFFDVDFGIDYTICARDEGHVVEVLRNATLDFEETWRDLGGAVITEIPEHEVWRRMFWDDGPEGMRRVPLVSMELGTYASTEF